MEFVRRVYENAKVTIPKELRELHGIENGDYVKLQIMDVIRKEDVPVNGEHGSNGASKEEA